MSFAARLIGWYEQHGRDLPWRNTRDPYVIWLSEVILQQTRVEQGKPYFHRFLEHYPTVAAFAEAPEGEIMRLWQGLGYYSRARNMHKAAKTVLSDRGGVFPTAYAELIRLPGVGEYTAAAISSLSVDEPRAVVDGNVYRVLSRYFGIAEPVNSPKGKKLFAELACEMLDERRPALYNQAIMDFGAMQCRPKNPACGGCVFMAECEAFRQKTVPELPVKRKAKKNRDRYFHYFVVKNEGRILMAKRETGDVWAHLYEFPLIETHGGPEQERLWEHPDFRDWFAPETALIALGEPVKQVLSHQNIYARFHLLEDAAALKFKKTNWDYFFPEKLATLAKHKLIFSFLDRNDNLINPEFLWQASTK